MTLSSAKKPTYLNLCSFPSERHGLGSLHSGDLAAAEMLLETGCAFRTIAIGKFLADWSFLIQQHMQVWTVQVVAHALQYTSSSSLILTNCMP